MLERFLNPAAILIAVALLIAAGAGFATGAKLINSKDVKNNSLQTVDIKDKTLKVADFHKSTKNQLKGPKGEKGAKGAPGPKGPQGPQGPPGEDATYEGVHWSVVDRNVIGNGDAYLRAGPSSAVLPGFPAVNPPEGVGSLGIRTGSGDDKAAFGNQVDFTGTPLSDLQTVMYWVFTTTENISPQPGTTNLPSVSLELAIDQGAPLPIFASLVFVPPTNTLPNQWRMVDASTAAGWGLSGYPLDQCGLDGPQCTLQEVKDILQTRGETAVIGSVQITKGRDYAFSGAVDALTINDTTYDFEPFGVSEVTQ